MRHQIFVIIVAILSMLVEGCSYHLRSNTMASNRISKIVLNSYDFYGSLTRSIRDELYLNGISIINDKKKILKKYQY